MRSGGWRGCAPSTRDADLARRRWTSARAMHHACPRAGLGEDEPKSALNSRNAPQPIKPKIANLIASIVSPSRSKQPQHRHEGNHRDGNDQRTSRTFPRPEQSHRSPPSSRGPRSCLATVEEATDSAISSCAPPARTTGIRIADQNLRAGSACRPTFLRTREIGYLKDHAIPSTGCLMASRPAWARARRSRSTQDQLESADRKLGEGR